MRPKTDFTRVFGPKDSLDRLDDWCEWHGQPDRVSSDPRWLGVLGKAFQQQIYGIEQWEDGQLAAILPIVFMKTRLFGKMLVSLPYLNVAGVCASADHSGDFSPLIAESVDLSKKLDVKYLQLRHETAIPHAGLNYSLKSKVNMRLPLPACQDKLWKGLKSSVRNQIRKGTKSNVRVDWGRHDRLRPFYDVFTRNMRDLGTPCYGMNLFRSILDTFPGAEICVGWLGEKPISAALVLHGETVTEVPSASSLRKHNSTNANMLMYWNLLKRAVEREQSEFDFGRSTKDGPHYKFKKQWGATPRNSEWQYCIRHGEGDGLRPESAGYALAIAAWKKMPVALTRLIGPSIIRGIP